MSNPTLDALEIWTIVGGSVGLTIALLWVCHEFWKAGCFGWVCRPPSSPRKFSVRLEEPLPSAWREAQPIFSAPYPNATPRVSSIY